MMQQLLAHSAIAYIAAVVTTQRKTFAGSGWWFRFEN